jgi:hypothetical protein
MKARGNALHRNTHRLPKISVGRVLGLRRCRGPLLGAFTPLGKAVKRMEVLVTYGSLLVPSALAGYHKLAEKSAGKRDALVPANVAMPEKCSPSMGRVVWCTAGPRESADHHRHKCRHSLVETDDKLPTGQAFNQQEMKRSNTLNDQQRQSSQTKTASNQRVKHSHTAETSAAKPTAEKPTRPWRSV